MHVYSQTTVLLLRWCRPPGPSKISTCSKPARFRWRWCREASPRMRTPSQVESLGSLFLEPVWVFYRKPTRINRLSDLKGRHLAVGAAGSGTYLLALRLLSADGISESNATLLRENLAQAAPSLLEGKIDDAFYVASPEAPLVRKLLEDPAIELLSFERAPAYTHVFPFLTSVTLTEGVLDLERNIPSRDTKLVAVAASLVARKDLNDSLIPALLKAITEVHREGGVLEQRGQFPSHRLRRHPTERRRPAVYHKRPFTIVSMVSIQDRGAAGPLKNIGAPFFGFDSAVSGCPAALQLAHSVADLPLVCGGSRNRCGGPRGKPWRCEAAMKRLRAIEKEVASVSVPLSYTGELYQLRLHIGFIKDNAAKLANRSVNES